MQKQFKVEIQQLKNIYEQLWGQRTWVPRPISNNKPKGPAEEENV